MEIKRVIKVHNQGKTGRLFYLPAVFNEILGKPEKDDQYEVTVDSNKTDTIVIKKVENENA